MGNNGVHPAPAEFSDSEIASDPILHFFHYAHLPTTLQETSKRFFTLAFEIIRSVPRNPERTVALRKLLEAKDAAVRANLPAPKLGQKELNYERTPVVGQPMQIGGDRDDDPPFSG